VVNTTCSACYPQKGTGSGLLADDEKISGISKASSTTCAVTCQTLQLNTPQDWHSQPHSQARPAARGSLTIDWSNSDHRYLPTAEVLLESDVLVAGYENLDSCLRGLITRISVQ
jgi:hypothetical protein